MRMSLTAMLAMTTLWAGCGNSDQQALRVWMQQIDAQSQKPLAPLAAPQSFVPFAYAHTAQLDPFSPNKLLAGLDPVAGVRPQHARHKEWLENFPLDTIKMVGTIEQRGVVQALLEVDHAVFQVLVGQHLGQNEGVITAIDERRLSIREIVQDGGSHWVERTTTLELQQSKEGAQ